ncbi:gas vesicle protein GvpJ [Streptomyces puniciscabiei]|uniref:gas vesicle protein n=1 Tax=Streptomyces puniciscabiei TaxID=164348 RepID=UPI0037945D3D
MERARHRPQEGGVAQVPGVNVANDASLVPRRLTEQFRTRMLHAADGLDGIHVDVTGPWAPYEHGAYDARPVRQQQVALIDLLDRLLTGGVVFSGDPVLSIADIGLVRISLRAGWVAVREQVDDQWATFVPPRQAFTGPGGSGAEPR